MKRSRGVTRCDAFAHAPDSGHAFTLGSYAAASPRLAMRWLRSRTRDIADQLDPAASGPVHGWLRDSQAHERALNALAWGAPYTFTIHDDGVRYLLTAAPRRSDDSPAPGR